MKKENAEKKNQYKITNKMQTGNNDTVSNPLPIRGKCTLLGQSLVSHQGLTEWLDEGQP